MPLDPWYSGTALTNLKDAHLYLAEWQDFVDRVGAIRDALGSDPTGGSTSLTDLIASFQAAQALLGNHAISNLRIDSDATNPERKIRVRCDGIGIEGTYVSGVDLVLDLAASGALGLDTGAEANATWYAIWLGANPDTGDVSALFSTSFTRGGITIPGPLADYTKWRRVGARFNNGSGDLRAGRQTDDSFLYDVDRDILAAVDVSQSGAATGITAGDASTLVPTTAHLAWVSATVFQNSSPTHTAGIALLYPGDTTIMDATKAPIRLFTAASPDDTATDMVHTWLALNDSSEFQYNAQQYTRLLVAVLGYRDTI